MFHRCLNDFFGYCDGEPQYEDGEKYLHQPLGRKSEAIVYSCASHCRLDPRTCGYHLTQAERNSVERQTAKATP